MSLAPILALSAPPLTLLGFIRLFVSWWLAPKTGSLKHKKRANPTSPSFSFSTPVLNFRVYKHPALCAFGIWEPTRRSYQASPISAPDPAATVSLRGIVQSVIAHFFGRRLRHDCCDKAQVGCRFWSFLAFLRGYLLKRDPGILR